MELGLLVYSIKDQQPFTAKLKRLDLSLIN
jgi:hypothetical protein